MGQHVFVVTAKSTAGVTYSPAKTVDLTLKAYYTACKGASITSGSSAATNKNVLLNASVTQAITEFTTTATICEQFLVYTATMPAELSQTNTGLSADLVTFPTTYGNLATVAAIASAKTGLVGTHTITVGAKDWWGVAQTHTIAWKLLISDSACEVATATFTAVGAEAVDYVMNAAAVDYAYSATALVPNYCKFSAYTADAVPVTNSINTKITNDATNNKFQVASFTGPNSFAGTYSLTASVVTLHGTTITSAKWTKAVTVKDPCTQSLFSLTAKSAVTYSIGAAAMEVYKLSSQVAQSGGDSTAFCTSRVTMTLTGIAVGDVSYFNTDYDTTGILSTV